MKKLRLRGQVLTWAPDPDLLRSEVHALQAVSWPRCSAVTSISVREGALGIAMSHAQPSTAVNIPPQAGVSKTPRTDESMSKLVLRWRYQPVMS